MSAADAHEAAKTSELSIPERSEFVEVRTIRLSSDPSNDLETAERFSRLSRTLDSDLFCSSVSLQVSPTTPSEDPKTTHMQRCNTTISDVSFIHFY